MGICKRVCNDPARTSISCKVLAMVPLRVTLVTGRHPGRRPKRKEHPCAARCPLSPAPPCSPSPSPPVAATRRRGQQHGPNSVQRPRRVVARGRAHLVGHVGPHQRGPAFEQLIDSSTRSTRTSPSTTSRSRSPKRRTSSRPPPSRLRRPGHHARRGGLGARVRLAGLPLRPRRHRAARGQQLPRDPAVDQRLRRQDLRRPAGHRHPRPDVQQGAVRGGRHHRPPTTWEEVDEAAEQLKAKAGVDGLYLNNGGYFLLPFIYGEGGDLVDTEAETDHGQLPRAVGGHQDRPGPGRRPAQPSSRTPTTPTAP